MPFYLHSDYTADIYINSYFYSIQLIMISFECFIHLYVLRVFLQFQFSITT